MTEKCKRWCAWCVVAKEKKMCKISLGMRSREEPACGAQSQKTDLEFSYRNDTSNSHVLSL